MAGVFSQDPLAYLCIAIPVLIPAFLWLEVGGHGIPVLPIISGIYFVYYAIPMLRSNAVAYDPDDLLRAAATVGIFLIAASVTSRPLLRKPVADVTGRIRLDAQSIRIIFVGLWGGVIYYVAAFSGNLILLSYWTGLVRAVVLTFTSIACFFLGCARASGSLVGERWVFALCAFVLLILLSVSSLLLIEGTMIALAAILGYSVIAKRVPWIACALAFAILSVLQAGKNDIRLAYWAPDSPLREGNSLAQIPDMMFAWLEAGLDALASGTVEARSDLLERASLLHMVLIVQRATPDSVPYLDGETYATFSSMIVPRFLDPEKTVTQAAMGLLSVRYGLLNAHATTTTAIGWGLVAEAYANFGYLGVIVIGSAFGGLCGVLMRISMGAPATSLRMLVTIAATVVLLNAEATLADLLTTLAQSIAAVLAGAGFLRYHRRSSRSQ
jgi:hypothetical protein